MCLQVDEHILNAIGLSDREALIAFACWLFDSERLDLWSAARLAGLTRPELEGELRKRGIAIYRPTVEDLAEDMRTLQSLGD